MANSRARITAHHESGGHAELTFGGVRSMTPRIEVSVSFDHGDADVALNEFECAIEQVRLQIAEVSR